MIATSAPRQSFVFRSGCLLAAMLGLAVLAGGAQRFGPRVLEPEHGARWIWATGDYGAGEPIAFYVVRDLELDAVESATVAITADDAYLLYVNGQRVGAGRYRPEAPLDEYQVSDYLQPGLNRILVEVRSSRGAGGLLAVFTAVSSDGGTRRVLATDDSWYVFRSYDPGLFGGWASLEAGESPKVWGEPPTGRWRLTPGRIRRPMPSLSLLPPARSQPKMHKSVHNGSWRELDDSQLRIPALGPQQIFDWGAEVTGIISFDLRSEEGNPGLLYVGDQPPDARQRPPDAIIVPVPGRREWQDARPRRFRYLLLVGAEPYSRVEVEVSDRAEDVPVNGHAGVFGIEPPRSYSRVEEQVWQRLEVEAKRAPK